MKMGVKVKSIAVAIIALISIGILLRFLFYNDPKQDTLGQLANQTAQKAYEKSIQSQPNIVNETITEMKSAEKARQLSETAKKDDQIKEAIAWFDSLSEDSQKETKKETPAELLQRWYRTQNTPEFQAYAHSVIEPLLNGEDIELADKIKELGNKETKLINDLETASSEEKSKIQSELEKVRSDIWETRITRSEKLILVADAIWSVHLKYFTIDELLAVRQEIGRNQPAPSNPTNQNRARMIRAEAIARLKARGWIPANPDESWY